MLAIVDVQLQYPYNLSLGGIHEFCNTWNLHILKAGTRQRIAVIAIPSKTFERLFGTKPKKGEVNVPEQLHSIIAKMTITDVQGK